tara:strand:+ start:211 stop:456 length:246 start_codon:yes stop_codon:yes gene_type:complete
LLEEVVVHRIHLGFSHVLEVLFSLLYFALWGFAQQQAADLNVPFKSGVDIRHHFHFWMIFRLYWNPSLSKLLRDVRVICVA